MSELQLTQDQANTAHDFAMFAASPLSEFVISGPAGVGKTHLLRHLRQNQAHIKVCQLLGKPPITKWAYTATTNKAAEVLGKSLGEEACTIHSFLNLRVFDDYATGKTKIQRGRPKDGGDGIIRDTLLVVDEASMVDKQLRRYINDLTMNCKIVYVGDHCQLAPIGEDISPVFVDNETSMINQIVRSQHTPAITALCAKLRNTVETGEFFDLRPYAEEGVIEFLDDQEAETEIYNHFVARNDGHARILCFTNQMAVGMNNWIRTARGLPEQFTVGEHVISNGATAYWDNPNAMTRVEQELTLLDVGQPFTDSVNINGEDVRLEAYDLFTPGGALRICLEPFRLKAVLDLLAKAAKNGNGSWHPYFALKNRYADVRPRDACTTHKSQGSTYETVFVHLTDIGRCTIASQLARMLYVACSRPTHRICFIGQLPDRLFR